MPTCEQGQLYEVSIRGLNKEAGTHTVTAFNMMKGVQAEMRPWNERPQGKWAREMADADTGVQNVRNLAQKGTNIAAFAYLNDYLNDLSLSKPGFSDAQSVPAFNLDENFVVGVIDGLDQTIRAYKTRYSSGKTPYKGNGYHKAPGQAPYTIRDLRVIIDLFGLDREDGGAKSPDEVAADEGVTIKDLDHRFGYSTYRIRDSIRAQEENPIDSESKQLIANAVGKYKWDLAARQPQQAPQAI